MKAPKIPYVFANLNLFFKNPPDQYHGITSENWSICKNGEQPLSVILFGLIKNTTMFYCNAMRNTTIEAINGELDKLTELMQHWRLKENK